MKNLIETIVAGAKVNPGGTFHWRQLFEVDSGMPYAASECATDGVRLAVRAVDAAPETPMSLITNSKTPPNIKAVWPQLSTLPNEIRLTVDACNAVTALAKVQEALSYKLSRTKRSFSAAEFEIGDSRSGYENTKLTINAAGVACIVTTLYGVVMTGGPIQFNLLYLSQALDHSRGSVIRFEDAKRPALIPAHQNAPGGSIVSILMPVTPVDE